jgi:hypothetical protein
VNEARCACDLRGYVEARRVRADDAKLRGTLGLDTRRRFTRQDLPMRQVPIAHLADAVVTADHAVVHRQLVNRNIEASRRFAQQQPTCFRAGMAQRASAVIRRAARGSVAFIGRGERIDRRHANARELDVELLGGNLRERRDDALSDLDLACEDRYRTVGLETHPLVEAPIRLEIAGELGVGGHVGRPISASSATRVR